MLNDMISNTIYLRSGMSVKVKQFKGEHDGGRFVLHGKHVITKDEVLVRGFAVVNSLIGTISIDDSDLSGVIYTHKKPEENAVWFFALTGERGALFISSVPIHDHSSVPQGGPAFGTYFSEYT